MQEIIEMKVFAFQVYLKPRPPNLFFSHKSDQRIFRSSSFQPCQTSDMRSLISLQIPLGNLKHLIKYIGI